MLAKIKSVPGVLWPLVLALALAGCTPAGPRALVKGKKCLDRGDVAGAVLQFKRATSLMATNAAAWNYLGVACQRARQPEAAANAYQAALRLDHDLVEVHYNLGVLWLEQNRPDLAKAELTAYTLRRPNDANGWLKLGFALLRAGDLPLAERSFSTVLSLKTSEAEAYNGLGLARLQAGRSRDAAEFLAAAVRARPNFGVALQNLATVDLLYLHDNRAALANYQAYLSLVPRPANYNEVKSLVADLVQGEAAAAATASAGTANALPPPPESKPKPVVAASHPAPVERSEPVEAAVTRPPSRPASAVATSAPPASMPLATREAQLRPAPTPMATPRVDHPGRPVVATPGNPKPADTNLVAAAEPLEAPMPAGEQPRYGFWHRLFKGDKPSSGSARRFQEDTSAPVNPPESTIAATPEPTPAVAPIALPNEGMAGTKPEAKPVESAPPPVTSGPRYAYTSPAKPSPGNRQGAEGGFTRARMAEQDENWVEAERWYQMAADADPSWFEAQFNAAVIAHRMHNYSVALPRYELALAVQPDSADARYNFALALKSAGYALDAVEELKKILATRPNEVRAHLALAGLYALSLHDLPEARRHYLRVLELQPDNPQAADIRFWLSANSETKKTE